MNIRLNTRIVFWLALFINCSAQIFAQDGPVLENNSPTILWSQIRTPNFQVIFPLGFEDQARRMANTLQAVRAAESKSLGTSSRLMPVIFQNQSSVSNAFVTLAPRRSEFFTMPTQNYNLLGNNDWLNLLVTHEYRHMAQFEHSIRGFNKIFSYAFGQEAVAGMAFLSVPQWFWEGDAVATETAFTGSGRGRIPEFSLVFRTNLLERPAFSYDKQYLRSYRNYVPDHYVLGYHMVSHLRKTSNRADIWGEITGNTWKVPFAPGRFSSSIRSASGIPVSGLYREMVEKTKQDWTAYLSTLKFTEYEVLNFRRNKVYTNYSYPQYLADGRVVVLKSGLGTIDQFVAIQDGIEEFAYMPGPVNNSGMLSAAGNKILWNEYRYDPRWPVKTWSVLRSHDVTGNNFSAQTLTSESRYIGGALSPDGQLVVTVESDQDYGSAVVLLSSNTGTKQMIFENNKQAYYSMPRFNETGEVIVALRLLAGKKEIVMLNVSDGKETILLPETSLNIGHPVMYKNYVLYNAPFGGIDNIFALDIKTGKQYQLTVAKYGAYNPCVSPDGAWIVYNNQDKNGMDAVRIRFAPETWMTAGPEPTNVPNTFDHLVAQEGRPHLLDTIPEEIYPIERYNKALKILNPHSWGAYVNSDLTRASLGISSKDVLSNLLFYAGAEYDIQEKTTTIKTQASFQTLYPIIDGSFNLSHRTVRVADSLEIITAINGPDTTRVKQNIDFSWREKNAELGLRFPFNLTTSRYFTQINLGAGAGLTSVSKFSNSYDDGGRIISQTIPQYFFRDYQDNGRLVYGKFGLTAYNLLRRSPRDINSRWGQVLLLNASTSANILSSSFTAGQFSAVGYLYVPGLLPHHSIWGYGGYQQTQINWRDFNNYLFRGNIPLPRGASVQRYEKIYTYSGNYTLPLFYPDLAIGPLAYIKRVRANTFVDGAFGKNPQLAALTNQAQQTVYMSVGAELKVDLNFIRLLPQFDFGVRFSQVLLPKKTFVVEVLAGTINF